MKRLGLHAAGAVTFCVWSWLAFRSQGAVSLGLLFTAIGAAWLLLGMAWWCGRDLNARDILRAIWFWGVLFRVAGFLGQPVLEDDWARYLWDGHRLLVSGNPYATSPADHFADDSIPEAFQRLLDEINNPDAPTIYGPVCQFAFALSHLIAPAKLWPFKLLLLTADLLTLALLLRLVPPRNTLLYAWCPLLIQETAFSAHPDSLWVFFMVAALHALNANRPVRLAIFCGLALATKFFAVIIVPFLLARVAWKHRALALLITILAYLPFWLQGSLGDFAGLARMAGNWEFNATVFAWLARWLGTSLAKGITLTAFTAIWFAMFWRWARSNSDKGAPSTVCHESSQIPLLPRGDVLFGVFFLLSAVVNPWYLLALLPFVVLQPSAWGVGALVVVTLSYAHGLNMSKPSLTAYEQPGWVPFSEFCVVALLVALVVGRRRRFLSAERNGD